MATLQSKAAELLSGIYSYVQSAELDLSQLGLTLDSNEHLLGMYVNSPFHVLLITCQGIHQVKDNSATRIPYNEILEIWLPEDESYRQLKLRFGDNAFVFLDCLHETEGVLDLNPLHKFLECAIYWPHQSVHTDAIRHIQTPRDLSAYLGIERDLVFESLELDMPNALRIGFPSKRVLRYFNIDQDLISRPDVWRLIALVMCETRTILSEDEIERNEENSNCSFSCSWELLYNESQA